MKLSIFGTGYVGLVTGACLAEVGHSVVCVDSDPDRIKLLNAGGLPIWEPGLEEIVQRNVREGRLLFTGDARWAVGHGSLLVIAVGTPPGEDGSADMQYVLQVADTIAMHMDGYRVVVNKSTVPVGTAAIVKERLQAVLEKRCLPIEFDVVSNPEFLKEGAAISDFLKPDRIVIGTETDRARDLMLELYEPFNRNHMRTMFMGVRSAELTKYAANALLATKISFMNEMANLAELMHADIEEVRLGIGSDPRIGYHFIYPGCGYGGSCFPKDVRALGAQAAKLAYPTPLLSAVETVNARQKEVMFRKIVDQFGGGDQLSGKTVAVWGLSFKPNTDDMREAPSRVLVDALLRVGAVVRAFDPVAMSVAKKLYGETGQFVLCDDKYDATNGADLLAICTEWPQFRSPDFDLLATRMKHKVIVDGRNMYSPQRLSRAGWKYLSIGRSGAGQLG